ncbi:hypothetical protein C8J57DRAFT_1321189 [Mycena rebaudengoi]|nr:hypothetical protein C8J57DRAFT_1321189 [Mycena rebaudengoi]
MELHWLNDDRTRCTTGSVVSPLYALMDPTATPAAAAPGSPTTGALPYSNLAFFFFFGGGASCSEDGGRHGSRSISHPPSHPTHHIVLPPPSFIHPLCTTLSRFVPILLPSPSSSCPSAPPRSFFSLRPRLHLLARLLPHASISHASPPFSSSVSPALLFLPLLRLFPSLCQSICVPPFSHFLRRASSLSHLSFLRSLSPMTNYSEID